MLNKIEHSNKGCKVWTIQELKKMNKKNIRKTKTPLKKHTQNKIKQKKEKKNPIHFSKWFFACSLPVSSSNSLKHKPFSYWNYVIC